MMQTHRFLRRFLLAGIFALPFIPLLIIDPLYFPFITGKNFAFRIIVELLVFAWAYLALAEKAYRPRFSFILASFAALLTVMAFADFFSVNPEKSFWSNFERMDGYITLLHLFAYFVVLSTTLSAEKLWERFFDTSIGASLLVVGYGYLQLFGVIAITQGSTRVNSTLGNAAYMAIYVIFHMFFAALLLARRAQFSWARYYYGAVILFEAIVLYYTATRGAILGFLGGTALAALLIALFERERRALRKGAVAVLVAMVVIIGGFFALRQSSFVTGSLVLSRFSQIDIGETGVNARFLIWNMAWQGIQERPLFGWGQESFNYVFNAQYDPRLYDQEQWFDRVHNIIFDWLIAGGFLGLFAYLALFGAALWYLWLGKRGSFSFVERAILTGLLAAYLFHNLFVFDNLVSYLLFFAVLAYLQSRSTAGAEPLAAGLSIDHGALARVGAPVMVVLACLSLYTVNYAGMRGAQTLLQALSAQGNPQINLGLFTQAAHDGPMAAQEAREQLALTAVNILPANVDPALKKQFIDTAITEMRAQIAAHEGDARTVLFLGTLLDQSGNHTEAVTVLKQAVALSPSKQQLREALAGAYINTGDTASALEEFKTALTLDTHNEEARLAYAAGAIYAGNNALAESILQEGFGTTVVPDMRLIEAYGRTKQYQKVIALWKAFLKTDPTNAQNHVSLAATYLAVEDRANAIAELERAIELNPSFKAQGEYYIGEIRAGRNP